jgi:uncharacterized protein
MYLVLSNTLRDVVENTCQENIKRYSQKFYKQLVESGCLIDCETNEVALLKQRIKEVDENPKIYHLIINPTMDCNFKCWYCYENHISKSKMNQETINNTKQLISNIMSNNETEWFPMSFFGGEPLLQYWDVVLPILKHYKECLKLHENIAGNISFTTNAYLINSKMIQSFKENNVRSFQITLDGTKDDHDNTRFPYKGGKSFDKITGNIIALLENGFNVVLRLNYTSVNAVQMKDVVALFTALDEKARIKLTVDFQRVWQDKNNSLLESETKTHIENCIELFNEANIATSHKYHDFVWNSCYADKKNEAVINYNGDVYKCTARDFSTSNRVGYLSDIGEIIWDKEKLKVERFSKPQCHNCRIAPICGGGCFQRHKENPTTSTCLLGYDDAEIDNIVLNKFYDDIVKNHEEVSLS